MNMVGDKSLIKSRHDFEEAGKSEIESLSHPEYCAIEKFVSKLKLNFPLIENPRNFLERMEKLSNEHAIKLINMELDKARESWGIGVLQEAAQHKEEK